MTAAQKPKEEERKFVFTSKLVGEVTEKINDGVLVKRFQNPWFQNEIGVRRAGLTFMMTEEEIQEYIKCKLDIQYFAEKYCRIKTEDGSVQNIRLRDYQKQILNLYTNNRFSILCGSRQIGKCGVFDTYVELDGNRKVMLGNLYYSLVSKHRNLTFVERTKLFIYNLISRFEGSQSF